MTPVLSNIAARRVFLAHHGLLAQVSGSGKGADLHALITELGFVQVDSVNTLARAHDLILWSRRQQYRPAALGHLLARERKVFEHWTHDAAVIPMAFYPHWRLRFARDEVFIAKRWKVWRRDGFMEKIDAVLARIEQSGGCTSRDVGLDEPRKSGGWWDWHPSKTALEYLWRTGQISVTRREGFAKVYDLTERVIPADILAQRPDKADSIHWLCNGAMDRLGFASSGELAAFWDTVTPAETRDWCRDELANGALIEVDIEGHDGSLRRSFARPGVLDLAQTLPVASRRVRILSPFDPALRDRHRAERLFGFHYRIEIFVPAAKRRFGYYVFPVLEGERLIGRIDVKAERARERLLVRRFWPEKGQRFGKGREARLRAELGRIARLAGVEDVAFEAESLPG